MRRFPASSLLWVDSLGGLAAGFGTLVLRRELAAWYGMPEAVLLGIALANLAYGSGSGALALTPRLRRPAWVAVLATANMAWGAVCAALFWRYGAEARPLGIAHLVLEGTYVAALGLLEWRWRAALAAGADTSGPQWALLECRVPPPVVALLSAVAMFDVARTWPGGLAVGPVVAAGLAAPGLVLAGWAIARFRGQATTIHPLRPHEASALVADGPNRWTRNPMYVGLLLVLGAWGLALGSAAALLVLPVAWGWLQRFQVLPEERALAARFGEAYAAYAARVRRWF